MFKNKKKPLNTGRLSPENYVKTQARTLPVVECLVSADWKSAGICSIIVVRGHKTGNITVGAYLVDLYCLGLKTTTYRFNIPPAELAYFMEGGAMKKCDYVLAHNIIYGAIEFAGDYGFNPHKGFTVTRFILEEDDVQVALMDIEFGLDEMPFYVRGPHDSDARVKNIEATLKSTAGEGNYSIADIDGDFGIDEDDLREDDEDPLIRAYRQLSEKYDQLIGHGIVHETLSGLRMGTDYVMTGEPIESEYVRFDSDEEKNTYLAHHEMLTEGKQLRRVIKELNEVMVSYPNKAVFYNLLQAAYLLNGEKDKSSEIIHEMRHRFPGYLYSKIAYANLMISEGRLDEAIDTFNGARDLHQLYPARNLFHETEASAFWGTMCHYFVNIGDAATADAYMQTVLKHDLYSLPNKQIIQSALTDLCKLKMNRLKELGAFEF